MYEKKNVISFQQWDECLCRADSDGDGKTNGEELGDPDCVWTMGDEPEMTQGISHPGNMYIYVIKFQCMIYFNLTKNK